ncbi:PAS domain S-box protein [Lutimonas halocynthiae]|uniref:PAS domain S-box protein n=1 Tax=Lutimonas halocynthiae TaxID=1446477 RepID=UPI0025B4E533|nr:PAS domain S-box protein [Lutimonas halocynthiae]MDN3642955.1 PAS domain S-box protein [Lutimonas halocynthiae]
MNHSFSFSGAQLDRIFPFYIKINRDLQVTGLGRSLVKVIPLSEGSLFNDYFSIPRPRTEIKHFDDLVSVQNQLIVLKSSLDTELTLRGQFELLEEAGEILFVGTPWFNSMAQITEKNLVINDFANHDPLVDLLHVLKSVELTNEDLKELISTINEQKSELKIANSKFKDVALFTEQNPDPLLRIDHKGNLIQNNPAAAKLDFIEYEGVTYRNDAFFKLIVKDFEQKSDKWELECSSNNIDYSFTCVPVLGEDYINFYGTDITRQKEYKLELEKLSLIVQKTVNAVIITDANGKIEWINNGFVNMTGYELLEVKGKTPGSLLQGEKTNPETIAYMKRQIQNKEPFTCEIYNYTKTGEGYWLRINAQPLFNDQGEVSQFFAIEEDITFEKQAQEKLENQRKFYEQILDNIPTDIAVFDPEHTYLYINPKGIKDPVLRKWMIGKKDEDYIKKRNKPLSLLDGRKKVFKSVLDSKKLKSWEEELKQPDDSIHYIMRNMFPVINRDDKVELVIGYGIDITNIKEIQHEKEQSEKRYRDVIDNTLAIVTTHDLNGRFLTVNPMVYKLYGYKDEEVIGRYLTDYMPKADKSLFHNVYLKKILKDKEATGVFRIRHKDGSIVYNLYNNFLKEEPGKEPYVIGFAVDITDRILAEKELKIAKKVTEDLARSKQNFLANMSHEIRTPMNAIMGLSSQLQKTSLNEKQQVYLETITNSSENLLVIINDVLDLAKLEAGKLSVENIGFDPKYLVEKVIQGMMYKAEEKGLKLTNNFCDPALDNVLIGDPYRLNQILLNLVSNSIKFTEKGGVDISCIVLEDINAEQKVEISVTDTGIGMDPLFVRNLFQKFSQEDASITRKFGGTGLGMSITHSLVDLMKGEIIVESEKGIGTTIKVVIDFQKGTASDLEKKEGQFIDTKMLEGKKILIVDDNETNRLVATTILEDYGVLSSEAENGAVAVKEVNENQFDMILMDIQMPELNGYEATKLIREKLKSQVAIVALTANAIKGENEKCIEAGMDGYLSKPFTEEQLLQIVCEWLDKPKERESELIIKAPKLPLYDLTKLEDIAKGNQKFIDKMLRLFITQVPDSVFEIKTAYQAGDFEKIKKIAHRIKPTIDIMEIVSLKNDIRDMEKNAEIYQSSERLENLINHLDDVIEEVVGELKGLV